MRTARLLAGLTRECLRHPFRVLLAALSLAGLGAAQLALPWIVKEWVEGPLEHGGVGDIGRALAQASAVVAAAALLLFSSRALVASVNQRMLARLRDRAVARTLQAEPATVRRYATGDLMSRVFQDTGMLSGFIEVVLRRLVGDGVLLVGALVMMFLIDFRLALVTCALAPLVGALLAGLGAVIRRWGAVAQVGMGGLGSTLQEQLQGFTTIKGYQCEVFETGRFVRQDGEYRRRAVRAETWTALLVALVFLAAAAGFILAVRYGSLEVTAGRITAGGLLAFCLYAGQTVEPVRRLAEVHGALQRSLAAGERLFELLELPVIREVGPHLRRYGSTPVDVPAVQTVQARRPSGGALTLERVRFSYPGAPPLLGGVDLHIGAGERVAVVAASGSGKTTLARLLVRFLEPESGRILLDGRDVRELGLSELRRAVCVVEQEPFLFGGPLADNVRYGSPGANAATVEEAMRLTGVDALREALPAEARRSVAEAGRDVSGGQRQRVALARAVVRDPAVLVLDEATSALDGDAEAEILENLERWFAMRTVIVMAHRLSSVRHVRRIVVLKDGRVAGEGSFEELVRNSGPFRELFAQQLEAAGVDATAAG